MEIKVLYVSVRGDFGGGPRHLNQLISELPQCVNVYVAFPFDDKPYGNLWKSDLKIKGIINIPHRKFSFITLIRLLKFIKSNKICVVHSHGQGAGLYSRILKVFSPHIIVIHTFHGITNTYNNIWKKFLNIIMNKIFKYLTNHFICVSDGEKKLGSSMGFLRKKDTSVIYNGIERISHQYAVKQKTFKVVTFSRFDYQKNMNLAYEIAKSYRLNPNIEFVWVGDGVDFERLKEMAYKENVNINFVGFSSSPMTYLLDASLYLSTSLFEGLPYALIEACACSVPIVATNVVGNNEVCIDGYNGILFSDKEGAINAINQIYNNIQLREVYSHNSYEMFENYFTIDKMIEKLIKVYKKYNS